MVEKGRIFLSVTGWDPAIWKEGLEKASPGRSVVLEPASADDPTIRYAVVWRQRPQVLARLPRLEAIFSIGAGVDHIFADPSVPDVPIIRVVSEDLTMRMSEYVVWQVLDHHRMGALYRQQQTRHVWREELRQPAANQVTVGIMGIGALGGDAARKLATIGFNVTGWSRRPKELAGIACHHGEAGLDPFLAGADILVVLLPLTKDTRSILNLDLFRRMKKQGPLGAPILINAGRGGLQSETDILQALDSQVLGAASLDVFSEEPLPADHPLWDHPRVTITPHAAANSDPAAIIPEMVRQIEAHEAGRPFENVVDRQAQY